MLDLPVFTAMLQSENFVTGTQVHAHSKVKMEIEDDSLTTSNIILKLICRLHSTIPAED